MSKEKKTNTLWIVKMGILLAIPFAAIVTFAYKEIWIVKINEITRKREGKKEPKESENKED